MRWAILLLLSGCATRLVSIDYSNPPPADWPRLEEKIAYVQMEDLAKFCGPKPSSAYAAGCTVAHFGYKTCYIYLASRDPALLAHERWHCKGYDHVGDTNRSRNAWERYKATAR
jgi:hypothetical protein